MIERSENEIAILAQFTAKAGQGEALLAQIYDVMGLTMQEPGCRRFVIYHSLDNPDLVTVIEKFASQADFDWHLTQPYIQNLLNVVVPELVEAQAITFHKEVLAPEPALAAL